VYRYAAAGRLECLIDNAPSPNGIVLNKDETMLYVAITRGNSIWRLPLMADGGVSKVGLFVQLSGGLTGPDGMALDDDDRLVVAHVGNGTVWVFTRFGEPVYRVRSCAGIETTNVAFGGEDGKKLYIVESETGSILAVDMDTAQARSSPDDVCQLQLLELRYQLVRHQAHAVQGPVEVVLETGVPE